METFSWSRWTRWNGAADPATQECSAADWVARQVELAALQEMCTAWWLTRTTWNLWPTHFSRPLVPISHSISPIHVKSVSSFLTSFSTLWINFFFQLQLTIDDFVARGASLADFIQPSLGPLQPNLDDFIDTLEPLQGDYSIILIYTLVKILVHCIIYSFLSWKRADKISK